MLEYDEWYEQIAAMLLSSDLPEAFVEDCLTNREAMQRLYNSGDAMFEAVINIRGQYRSEREEQIKREIEEAGREAKKKVVKYVLWGLLALGIVGGIKCVLAITGADGN